MAHPIQPIYRDADGVLRFHRNGLVEVLLEQSKFNGGYGLDEMARSFSPDEHGDDWRQLVQLLGFTVGAYGALPYVDDDTYGVVLNRCSERGNEDGRRIEGMTEEMPRIQELELELAALRNALRGILGDG